MGKFNQGIFFKVTFIDLIFKSVFKLEIKKVEKKGLLGKKMVNKIYIYEGKNFNMPLKPHEEVFRKYLPRKVNSKRFKKLQKEVYIRYNRKYAKKKLLEPLALKGYFNEEKKYLRKKYSLSDKGLEAQRIILRLKEEGKNLEDWLETDPQRARAYLLIGGSNIFLTDDYNFDWFKANFTKLRRLFSHIKESDNFDVSNYYNEVWYSSFILDSENVNFDDINSLFSDFQIYDSFDSMDAYDFNDGFDSAAGDNYSYD